MGQAEFKQYVRNELTHSPPGSPQQINAHKQVTDLFLMFGEKLAEVVPVCDDAESMVQFLTLARALAQKAVAQNFNMADYLDNGGEL